MFKFNCFCIDLTLFDSEDDLFEFLQSNNIDHLISATNLWEAKTGRFTQGVTINKVWVDSVTYCVTAYKTDTESKFTEQYVEFLNSIEPLSYGEGVVQMEPSISDDVPVYSTIDEILDKINKFGMNSLTQEELDILRDQ